jgi:type IX secretion system PorP/SprF family membrane protein
MLLAIFIRLYFKRCCLFLFTYPCCSLLFAQQTPLYSQYFLNQYLYNPALAGYSGVPSAFFLYRKQWVSVNGAPETQVFTLDTKLNNENIGLGLTFFNDVTNIIGRTSGALTGSYKIDLTSNQQLRFGLSFLAIQNRIFFDRIQADDISDPNLLSAVDQRTVFESNAGLHYTLKKFHVGFASEQLFQNTIKYNNEALFQSLDYTFIRHYYTTADYTFAAGPNIEVKPMVLIRTVQGLPSQADFNLMVNYKQLVWLNMNYRPKIGAGLSIGTQLAEQFVFGYTYEFPTTDLSILGSSTHEFVLGLRLRKSGDSPIAREKGGSIKSLEKQSAIQYEKIDALKQENELVSGQLNETQSQLAAQNEELRLLREIVSGYQEDLSRAIVRLQANPDDTTSVAEGPYYLVVGALRNLDDAKLFQRILKREAGLDTKVTQSASGTWYFVYSQEMNELENANGLINELMESKARPFIIGVPWIYKWEQR